MSFIEVFFVVLFVICLWETSFLREKYI